mgnify:CR=1 FL=1
MERSNIGDRNINKKAAKTFIKQRDRFSGKDYLFSIIGYHLAAVLEKQKPAVLLSFNNTRRNLFHLWNKYKAAFPSSGRLKYFEIKSSPQRICVLFYNPLILHLTLKQEKTISLLKEYGYSEQMTIDEYLLHLKTRFNTTGFPHEIGVFLGIPAEDVLGFITNKGKNYKSYGYWKVYVDPFGAKKIFNRIAEAKSRYTQFLQRGISPGDYLERYYY